MCLYALKIVCLISGINTNPHQMRVNNNVYENT